LAAVASAADITAAYISGVGGRQLTPTEWGLTLPAEQAAGWPLDMSVRIVDGLLRVQAFALEADDSINPWNFLHWNRSTRYVRFACTRSGDIWVQADLPVAAIDERELDRVLGLVAEAAVAARNAIADRKAPPRESPWLTSS
jgi:hypothetical protein